MSAVSILVAFVIGATAYNEAFDQALEHYRAGHFAESIALYEQLVAERVERPEVFLNLANAYLRNGQYPAAIANYERALRLDPTMEEAQFNLTQCVGRTKRRLERPENPGWESALLFWHDTIPRSVAHWTSIAAWVVLWLVLALRLWRPLPYLRLAALAALVIAVAFGASAWIKYSPSPLAVARYDHTPVRFGTSEDDDIRFELFEGDRVLIDGKANGWVRVTIADGERGWTRLDNLIRVGPPYENGANDTTPETNRRPG